MAGQFTTVILIMFSIIIVLGFGFDTCVTPLERYTSQSYGDKATPTSIWSTIWDSVFSVNSLAIFGGGLFLSFTGVIQASWVVGIIAFQIIINAFVIPTSCIIEATAGVDILGTLFITFFNLLFIILIYNILKDREV